MTFRTLTVSILAAMYLADFCRYSNAAEIGDLQHVLEAVSEESLSSLAESKDINWPSMSLSFSAIPVVPGSSGAVRVSQNIALKLLDILKGYESSLDNDTSIEPINQFKVYSLVGMRLERAGGSLNICLLDSLNRCAMARLCHSVLSASLGLEAAQKTLESLYVPKYDKSFLENLMSNRMSRDQATDLFAKLPPTSALSRLKRRVEFSEFDACIGGCETPVDPGLHLVSYPFPRCNSISQFPGRVEVVFHALAGKNTQFNFRHIEPTAMFGSVVNLQFLSQTPGFLRFESLIETGLVVRVEVVHHQHDLYGLRIQLVA